MAKHKQDANHLLFQETNLFRRLCKNPLVTGGNCNSLQTHRKFQRIRVRRKLFQPEARLPENFSIFQAWSEGRSTHIYRHLRKNEK